jgi:pimeloyl-ACP methyl ester carboxylesterase/DNA-binding CsgD family transcriptional regulator
MRPPQTRYTTRDGASIAYQVLGQAAFDLVLVSGFVSNLEIQWEDSGFAQLARRLAAFSRLILIDKRGTGLSDRHLPEGVDALELAAGDIAAVMEAAGSGRAALLGAFDGAGIARRFAQRFPARTRALVLYAPSVARAENALAHIIEKHWGLGDTASLLAPEQANDGRFRGWWARFERLSASPSEATALLRPSTAGANLASLGVPVLAIHRSGDMLVPAAESRALAMAGVGAVYVELPGRDHLLWSGDVNRLADTVEEFLTGHAPVPIGNRMLAALLVARIANPERQMARLGEDRWQDRLGRFAAAATEAIAHHAGQSAPSDPASARGRFDSPAAAIRATFAIKDVALKLGLPVAIGLNLGEIDKDQQLPSSLAYVIAEEIARQAAAGEVLASRSIADLCGSLGQSFFDHLPLLVEGATGPVHVVSIGDPNPMAPREKLEREPDLTKLSARECEVLKLVAEGMSNSAIASALRLSEHTVKRHVANILMKLDLPTRAAAAVLADKLPA